MKPTNFEQATKTLNAPIGNAKNIGALPVWSDGKQCVSKWHPSITERVKIAFGGGVYLGVLGGGTQPSVFVTGNNPFELQRVGVFSRVCNAIYAWRVRTAHKILMRLNEKYMQ